MGCIFSRGGRGQEVVLLWSICVWVSGGWSCICVWGEWWVIMHMCVGWVVGDCAYVCAVSGGWSCICVWGEWWVIMYMCVGEWWAIMVWQSHIQHIAFTHVYYFMYDFIPFKPAIYCLHTYLYGSYYEKEGIWKGSFNLLLIFQDQTGIWQTCDVASSSDHVRVVNV
jgi:hypothetical protein